ncbi:TIGR03085 family metal-binding protein [Luteococcus sediminum]
MSFSQDERLALCDLLEELGPDAPTLCEGWQTHDMAAHLWLRETDPLAMPGMIAAPLEGLTERRMDALKRKLGYEELIGRIRKGPPRFSLFALPGLDEAGNATEYFVHHEDVRRAQAPELGMREPRALDDSAQEVCWKRVSSMGRLMVRRSPVAVSMQRLDAADGGPVGNPVRLGGEGEGVVLRGLASELLLFCFGRTEAAAVELRGAPEDVVALQQASIGL